MIAKQIYDENSWQSLSGYYKKGQEQGANDWKVKVNKKVPKNPKDKKFGTPQKVKVPGGDVDPELRVIRFCHLIRTNDHSLGSIKTDFTVRNSRRQTFRRISSK